MSIHWLNLRFSICLFAALVAGAITDAQERKTAEKVVEVRISAKPYVPAPISLRVETELVEVGVVVRGHDGHAISGLKRENFVVMDQGSSRELNYFAVETPGFRPETSQTGIGGAGFAAPGGATGEQPGSTGVTAQIRFIALYFEDFGTDTGDLKRAQIAGRRFVNEGLDDSDRVAIFSTSGDFVDYTGDKSKLAAAIDKLKAHPKFPEAGPGGCPRISPYQAYQISVLSDPGAIEAANSEAAVCASNSGDDSSYNGATRSSIASQGILAQAEMTWAQVRVASQATLDAIGRAMRSLQTMPGRRLFLMVSSGFNSGTLELERDKLISLALRAGIVINSIDAKGLYAEVPGRGPNEEINTNRPIPAQTFRFETSSTGSKLFQNNQVMSDFAQATGGLFFHNNNDLPNGFRQLGSIPEVSYVLGFRGDTSDGKYHKLKVALSDSKPYVIQARPGYFATAPVTSGRADAAERERALDREVSGVSTLKDFAATVAFRLDNASTAGFMTVKTQVHVAIDKLQFPIREERRVQRLKVVVALVDGNGNVVAAKEGTMDFAMADTTYARLSASGINAGLNLDVPPGKYRLRAVVQEAVEGKMASSSVNIEVK
jgi:VWFA-related protein